MESFEEPILQKHWRNIEALTLDRDAPEEMTDYTCKLGQFVSLLGGGEVPHDSSPTVQSFENPVLQKHWRNIEALALDRDAPKELYMQVHVVYSITQPT